MIKRRRIAAAPPDVPADFGTPVSDSIEASGKTMIEIARWLRQFEPLPLHVLRDYGRPLMKANLDVNDRLSALMRADWSE